MTAPAETAHAWWRSFRVLDEPTETFVWLKERPRSLVPLIAFLLVALAAAFVTPAKIYQDMARQRVEAIQERSPDFSDEQGQEMIDNAATTRSRIFVSGAQIAFGLVSFAIVALVLMLIFNSMTVEPIRFREEWSIVLHSYIPQLAGALLIVLLMRFAGFEQLRLSLGFLFDRETSPFLNALGNHVHFFGVWNVYLLALGNQVRTGSKGIGAPLGIVGGLWLLVGIAFAAIAGMFGSLGS
ncbi:MAG: YIP1 family protein [Gemmatimonadales bacterium]